MFYGIVSRSYVSRSYVHTSHVLWDSLFAKTYDFSIEGIVHVRKNEISEISLNKMNALFSEGTIAIIIGQSGRVTDKLFRIIIKFKNGVKLIEMCYCLKVIGAVVNNSMAFIPYEMHFTACGQKGVKVYENRFLDFFL